MRVKKLREYKTNEQRFIYWPQILSFAFNIPLPLFFFALILFARYTQLTCQPKWFA